MALVAERLRPRVAASAEGDRLTLREHEFASLRVDHPHRAFDLVRSVGANLYDDLAHPPKVQRIAPALLAMSRSFSRVGREAAGGSPRDRNRR
jgi:hypothetical protein